MGQFFQHLAQTTPRSQQEPAADCINTVPFFWEAQNVHSPFFLIVILNEVRERMF
jgi:hypothetical protein